MSNATASDVGIGDIHLNGGTASADVTNAITGTQLTQTITGASTIRLDLQDATRALVRSQLCTARTLLDLDDLPFELVQVSKQTDTLSLTFEDYAVSCLRQHKNVVTAASGTTSRVEFCRRMIAKDEPWITVLGPKTGASTLEEISTGQTTSTVAASPVDQLPVKNAKGTTGISPTQAATYLYNAGFRGADLVVAVAVAHAESGFDVTNIGYDSNGTHDVGLMQVNSVHGYTNQQMFDPQANANAAFKIWKAQGWHNGWSTYASGAYRQFMAAAQDAVKAIGANVAGQAPKSGPNTSGAPTTGVATSTDSSKPEDHWTAITRIMGEINWRVFARRGQIVIAPDSWLLKQPGITINEATDGVDSIDFDVDRGKKVSTITVTCRAERWYALPGEPITVTGLGPADDTWLVSQIQRSLTSETATISLIKKQKGLPEPASSSSSSGGAWTSLPKSQGGTVYRGGTFAGLDQGVDWTGSYTIHAPDAMTITRVDTNSGWPGGTLIAGRFTDGQYKGRYAYFAEAIKPAPGLRAGSTLARGDLIGTVNSPYPGSETGFAQDANGTAYGNTSEGKGGSAPDPQARAWAAYIGVG